MINMENSSVINRVEDELLRGQFLRIVSGAARANKQKRGVCEIFKDSAGVAESWIAYRPEHKFYGASRNSRSAQERSRLLRSS
jgi:hypothetical protein